MRCGNEVTITPDAYPDFFLVHLGLKTGGEVETDAVMVPVPEGSVLISAPRRSIGLRWQENCEQLILRVSYAAAGIERRTVQRSGALFAALPARFFSSLTYRSPCAGSGVGRMLGQRQADPGMHLGQPPPKVTAARGFDD